jgi:hypothetical protein
MNRQMRKQELLRWSYDDEGKSRIVSLYMKSRGIPEGMQPTDMMSTHIRSEMIPAILDYEFPKA